MFSISLFCLFYLLFFINKVTFTETTYVSVRFIFQVICVFVMDGRKCKSALSFFTTVKWIMFYGVT